jgi:hypothetical protein
MNKCGNCDSEWTDEQLNVVKNLFLRVLPGEPMPSGECPECGALCHPIEESCA